MKSKSFLSSAVVLLLSALCHTSQATTVQINVQASQTRTSPSNGIDTGIFINVGDQISITSSKTDLWNVRPGYSNQNADGSPINCNSGNTGTCSAYWTSFGLTAPVGALAGYIGNGDSFLIGTNFQKLASTSGELFLHSFDGVWQDNTGEISVSINTSAVPEPEIYLMTLLGVIVTLTANRRRKALANLNLFALHKQEVQHIDLN
jgi:hypothetical protein